MIERLENENNIPRLKINELVDKVNELTKEVAILKGERGK